MFNQKGFAPLLLITIIVVVVLIGLGGYLYFLKYCLPPDMLSFPRLGTINYPGDPLNVCRLSNRGTGGVTLQSVKEKTNYNYPYGSINPISESTNSSSTNKKAGQRIAECAGIANEPPKQKVDTGRDRISLPEEIYPFEKIKWIEKNASAGVISNGLNGPNLADNIDNKNCWNYYYQFDWTDESQTNVPHYVELHVPSAIKGDPDYF